MNATVLLMVASLVGVDVGWQATSDGGLEYIIQIEPEMVESLRSGNEIVSDIPPALRGMVSYRIRVGSDPLPHDPLPSEAANPPRPDDVNAEPEEDAAATERDTVDQTNENPTAVVNERPPVDDGGQWPAINGPTNFAGESEPSDETNPPELSPTKGGRFDLAGEGTAPPDDSRQDGVPNRFHVDGENVQPVQPAAGYEAPEETAVPDHAGVDGAAASAAPQDSPPSDDGGSEPESWPQMLILAVIGLFVSLGANLYLGWITWGLRSRYRALVEMASMRKLATTHGE